MKRTFTLPALALGAALSLGACAQDGVTAPTSAPNAPSLAQSGAQTTFGNLIAALNNIAVNIDELNALNDLTIGDITVVNVEQVLNGNNVEALNNALNNNNIEILNLREVLSNNVVILEVLRNADIQITDVIAIDVLSGGDVNVFVQ